MEMVWSGSWSMFTEYHPTRQAPNFANKTYRSRPLRVPLLNWLIQAGDNMRLTGILRQVRDLTRVNVIDNSEIGRQVKEAGKKVKIIRVYNKSRKQMGGLGVKVLVTILGQMKKGYITGCVQTQQAFIPKFDKNNIVLVDNNNVPLGTRVTSPLPNYLRKQGAATARIMAIGTRFV